MNLNQTLHLSESLDSSLHLMMIPRDFLIEPESSAVKAKPKLKKKKKK
jgi:hypothetical protein